MTALGYGGLTSTGNVSFSPSAVNDSRTNPTSGKYDLQSTMAHEIDEILNIGGQASNLNQVANGNATLADPPDALDLFRYSAPGVRSYSTSNEVSSYFSIDGGVKDLVHFNQNGAADGSDYGDWDDGVAAADGQANSPAQIQDAYAYPYDGTADTLDNFGPSELTALDVVGWDLTPLGTAIETGSAVPEPGMLGLLAISGISLLTRRRAAK